MPEGSVLLVEIAPAAGLVRLSLVMGFVEFAKLVPVPVDVGLVGLVGLAGFVGLTGLVGLAGFVGLVGLVVGLFVGLVGLVGLIGFVGLVGLLGVRLFAVVLFLLELAEEVGEFV